MDGIAQWWLDLTPASFKLVERALDVLEQARVVTAARAPDGRVRYHRRAPDARADADAIEAELERLSANPADPRPPPPRP